MSEENINGSTGDEFPEDSLVTVKQAMIMIGIPEDRSARHALYQAVHRNKEVAVKEKNRLKIPVGFVNEWWVKYSPEKAKKVQFKVTISGVKHDRLKSVLSDLGYGTDQMKKFLTDIADGKLVVRHK